MTGTCYYHPDTPAVDTCVQCGMAICQNCRDRVAEKTVCRKCVGAVRARLEQQMAAGGPPAGAGAAPQNLSGSPAYAAATGQNVAPLDPGRRWMALGLALVIAVVGAIITEKILFYKGFGLSLLYIGIGYAIGFTLHSMLGRGGGSLALTACGIMLVGLVVGELFFVQDAVNAYNGRHGAGAVSFMEAAPTVISHMGFMHWVCILIGLAACYRGVEAQG